MHVRPRSDRHRTILKAKICRELALMEEIASRCFTNSPRITFIQTITRTGKTGLPINF